MKSLIVLNYVLQYVARAVVVLIPLRGVGAVDHLHLLQGDKCSIWIIGIGVGECSYFQVRPPGIFCTALIMISSYGSLYDHARHPLPLPLSYLL